MPAHIFVITNDYLFSRGRSRISATTGSLTEYVERMNENNLWRDKYPLLITHCYAVNPDCVEQIFKAFETFSLVSVYWPFIGLVDSNQMAQELEQAIFTVTGTRVSSIIDPSQLVFKIDGCTSELPPRGRALLKESPLHPRWISPVGMRIHAPKDVQEAKYHQARIEAQKLAQAQAQGPSPSQPSQVEKEEEQRIAHEEMAFNQPSRAATAKRSWFFGSKKPRSHVLILSNAAYPKACYVGSSPVREGVDIDDVQHEVNELAKLFGFNRHITRLHAHFTVETVYLKETLANALKHQKSGIGRNLSKELPGLLWPRKCVNGDALIRGYKESVHQDIEIRNTHLSNPVVTRVCRLKSPPRNGLTVEKLLYYAKHEEAIQKNMDAAWAEIDAKREKYVVDNYRPGRSRLVGYDTHNFSNTAGLIVSVGMWGPVLGTLFAPHQDPEAIYEVEDVPTREELYERASVAYPFPSLTSFIDDLKRSMVSAGHEEPF